MPPRLGPDLDEGPAAEEEAEPGRALRVATGRPEEACLPRLGPEPGLRLRVIDMGGTLTNRSRHNQPGSCRSRCPKITRAGLAALSAEASCNQASAAQLHRNGFSLRQNGSLGSIKRVSWPVAWATTIGLKHGEGAGSSADEALSARDSASGQRRQKDPVGTK